MTRLDLKRAKLSLEQESKILGGDRVRIIARSWMIYRLSICSMLYMLQVDIIFVEASLERSSPLHRFLPDHFYDLQIRSTSRRPDLL